MLINDSNGDIMNVYQQLRYDASAVVKWLSGMAHTKEEFLRQRELFNTDPADDRFFGTTHTHAPHTPHTRTHTHAHTAM